MTNDTLKPEQEAEFLRKSLLFGHDVNSLPAEEEAVSFVTVDDLATFSQWVCNADETEKALRAERFFHPAIAGRSRLGQGMHDRGEAYVFAGAPLESKDSRGLANHMPFHMKVMSVRKKIIRRNEIWDVSVTGEQWGLDEMEELYVALNVGVLILEPGARLVVRGNVFSLLCQQLICEADAADHHIGILPTPFSVDFGMGPHNGPDGAAGNDGANAGNGTSAIVEKTLLGYKLQVEIDPADMNGKHGAHGTRGTDGVKGRNGGMAKLAELTFREVKGSVSVFSQAGAGGDGGNGGSGGNGGNGGTGAAGYKLVKGILSDGMGGNGGNGGDGGDGGNGGNGGLSSNIYITVPQNDLHKVTRRSLPSVPGMGGAGGSAGKGGSGGKTGSGDLSPEGMNGEDGITGKQGINGRGRPGAHIFLNGRG